MSQVFVMALESRRGRRSYLMEHARRVGGPPSGRLVCAIPVYTRSMEAS